MQFDLIPAAIKQQKSNHTNCLICLIILSYRLAANLFEMNPPGICVTM